MRSESSEKMSEIAIPTSFRWGPKKDVRKRENLAKYKWRRLSQTIAGVVTGAELDRTSATASLRGKGARGGYRALINRRWWELKVTAQVALEDYRGPCTHIFGKHSCVGWHNWNFAAGFMYLFFRFDFMYLQKTWCEQVMNLNFMDQTAVPYSIHVVGKPKCTRGWIEISVLSRSRGLMGNNSRVAEQWSTPYIPFFPFADRKKIHSIHQKPTHRDRYRTGLGE